MRDESKLDTAEGQITWRDFRSVNEHDQDVIAEVEALAIGESVSFGGGAAPLLVVTRVS